MGSGIREGGLSALLLAQGQRSVAAAVRSPATVLCVGQFIPGPASVGASLRAGREIGDVAQAACGRSCGSGHKTWKPLRLALSAFPLPHSGACPPCTPAPPPPASTLTTFKEA